MEQPNETDNKGAKEVRTPEHANPGAIIEVQNDTEVQSLTLTREVCHDQLQIQNEELVETLPQGRKALLDYDLRDWESATYFATRTQYGQHVIGWVFEQVLEKMPSGVVSYSVLVRYALLTHLDGDWRAASIILSLLPYLLPINKV